MLFLFFLFFFLPLIIDSEIIGIEQFTALLKVMSLNESFQPLDSFPRPVMLWEPPKPPLDNNDGSDQSEEGMLVPLFDRQDPLDHLAFAHDNPTLRTANRVLELFILALGLCLDQLFDYVFWWLFIRLAGGSVLQKPQVAVGPLIICWALQAARKPYFCALIAWRYDNPIGLKA